MTRLTASELEAVLSFLEEVHGLEGPSSVAPELLDRLARLVHCEDASFFEVDHPKRVVNERVVCSWHEQPWHGMPDDVWTCARTVVLQRRKLAGGPGPIALSDVFERRLRVSKEFNPNRRDEGWVDDIHVDLDPPRRWRAQLSCFSTRDFGARERRILQLVRPHLAAIYQTAMLRRRLSELEPTLDAEAVAELTPREREVIECVARGLSNAEIARVLVVELSTVRKHLEHVYAKLGVRRRTAAVAKVRG
jgi:DNA-binding CsgD family transcriptional regulator